MTSAGGARARGAAAAGGVEFHPVRGFGEHLPSTVTRPNLSRWIAERKWRTEN